MGDSQNKDLNGSGANALDGEKELEGFAVFFELVGKMLYANPEFEWLNNLASQGVFSELPFPKANENIMVGQKLLNDWFGGTDGTLSRNAVEEVKCDYVPLFLNGKYGACASPWESIYVNSSPAFFQCSTMAVRMWYKRYSLKAENQEHEPDDHIGLELIFLGNLCAIASGMRKPPIVDGSEYPMSAVRIDVAEFARTHVLNWATHWCDIVYEKANTDYYRGLALLTKGALEAFAEEIGESISVSVYR